MRSHIGRALSTALLSAALLASGAAQASAHTSKPRRRPPGSSGVIQLTKPRLPRIAAAQSENWFGYDQGALEAGRLFTEAGATWTVPTASQHQAGTEEDSATWVGIGGGCVNEGCTISDPTGVIQTGTEQNVEADGTPRYEAWWELAPLPASTITGMRVAPGDRMRGEVAEVPAQELPSALEELPQTLGGVGLAQALEELGIGQTALARLGKRSRAGRDGLGAINLAGLGETSSAPGLGIWRITLRDLTSGQSATETAPFLSSHASAEWIEETPLGISTGGIGLTALPNLSETPFESATVNGEPARLSSSQAIDLVSESQLIGSVSAPNASGDGFDACAWSAVCPPSG